MDDMFFLLTTGPGGAPDPQAISVSTTSSSSTSTACLLTLNLTVWYDANAFPGFIGNGMTLYTTSALTTKWNGGLTSNYHRITLGARGIVSSVGVVSGFDLC